MEETLEQKIRNAINQSSAENNSDTPDFILAKFLIDCLEAFDTASNHRERWYGVHHEPGKEPMPINGG